MTVPTADLVAALDAELRIDAFADGQENGLQIEGRPDASRVALAVSVSADVLDAALDWGADALLTHHGLLWHNQPLHVRGVRRNRLARILAAELNLLTYHLPLDAHPTLGNNAALADAAGCTATTPAFPHKGQTIGAIGTLAAPTPFNAWVTNFEAALRQHCGVPTGPFAVWPHGPNNVQTIGFVSGAAPYQIQDAIDAGCHAYVTGETTEGIYHLAREAGIHFIAGGHYLTERLGVQRLGAWLEQQFPITTAFFDVETLA